MQFLFLISVIAGMVGAPIVWSAFGFYGLGALVIAGIIALWVRPHRPGVI